MKKILLGLFISLFLITQGYCADIARLHNFLDGEILTAALLNNEFDNIITETNDLDSDNLASNIAITTSGTATFTGTFNAQGTSLNLGNGGSDVLTLNAAGGITYTPAATWTFTGAQTVSGTWANLGTVTTTDINGGTIDGVTIGGASAGAGSFTTISASGVITSTQATGTAPFTIASTTKVTNLNADTVDGQTFPAVVAGDILYGSDNNTLSALAKDTDTNKYLRAGNTPSYVIPPNTSNVIFQWTGYPSPDVLDNNGTGIYLATATNPSAYTANIGFTIFNRRSAMGGDEVWRKVLRSGFLKVAGVNTLTVYYLAASGIDGTGEIKVGIGSLSVIENGIGNTNFASMDLVPFGSTLDVSSLTNGTFYQLIIYLDGSEQANCIQLASIIIFGS